MRNLSERGGTGKLRSHWEEYVYVVVDVFPDIPVYKVKREDGVGKVKTLHRNLLMKCEFLPCEKPIVRKRPLEKKKTVKRSVQTEEESETYESSSDDIPVGVKKALYDKILKRKMQTRREEREVELDSPEEPSLEQIEGDESQDDTTVVPASDVSSDSSESDTESLLRPPVRPTRERKPPRILTYDSDHNAYYTTKPFRKRK